MSLSTIRRSSTVGSAFAGAVVGLIGTTFVGSAAAVWQFAPDFHLKVNWAMGFLTR
jgi:hypothetical protein